MVDNEKDKVTLGEKEYSFEDLTDQGKAIFQSLKFVDKESAETQSRIAVLNTARTSYMKALQDELPVVNN
jgi:flagellar biosynthesis/type III secretory pathway chaperone